VRDTLFEFAPHGLLSGAPGNLFFPLPPAECGTNLANNTLNPTDGKVYINRNRRAQMLQHLVAVIWFRFQQELNADHGRVFVLSQLARRYLQGGSRMSWVFSDCLYRLCAFLTADRRRYQKDHAPDYATPEPNNC
jgi:hypothetical protein